jgi:hypothetical protein
MKSHRIERLLNYCRPSQKNLKVTLAGELLRLRGKERVMNRNGFLYSPGSHPVLLVAHLDTVHKQRPTSFYIDTTRSPDGDLWCKEGIGGDDRCGIFIVMELIERLDCHVLFTEDEEVGGRGAIKFCEFGISPDVQYIVEFDRRGKDDAVFYGCDNPDFTEFVEGYGFRESNGTFSDISYIAPALGIAAVNLSSGYYQAHTRQEYIRVADVKSIIERAARLISNVETHYEYIETEYMDWHWQQELRIADRLYRRNCDVRCPWCEEPIDDAKFSDYCRFCSSELLVECSYCGDDAKLSDCAVFGNEVYCRFCLG